MKAEEAREKSISSVASEISRIEDNINEATKTGKLITSIPSMTPAAIEYFKQKGYRVDWLPSMGMLESIIYISW